MRNPDVTLRTRSSMVDVAAARSGPAPVRRRQADGRHRQLPVWPAAGCATGGDAAPTSPSNEADHASWTGSTTRRRRQRAAGRGAMSGAPRVVTPPVVRRHSHFPSRTGMWWGLRQAGAKRFPTAGTVTVRPAVTRRPPPPGSSVNAFGHLPGLSISHSRDPPRIAHTCRSKQNGPQTRDSGTRRAGTDIGYAAR